MEHFIFECVASESFWFSFFFSAEEMKTHFMKTFDNTMGVRKIQDVIL